MSDLTKSLERAPYWKLLIAYWGVLFLKAMHPRRRCICLERIGDNGPCPVHTKGA
jgi:hypothetical protein